MNSGVGKGFGEGGEHVVRPFLTVPSSSVGGGDHSVGVLFSKFKHIYSKTLRLDRIIDLIVTLDMPQKGSLTSKI